MLVHDKYENYCAAEVIVCDTDKNIDSATGSANLKRVGFHNFEDAWTFAVQSYVGGSNGNGSTVKIKLLKDLESDPEWGFAPESKSTNRDEGFWGSSDLSKKQTGVLYVPTSLYGNSNLIFDLNGYNVISKQSNVYVFMKESSGPKAICMLQVLMRLAEVLLRDR